MKFSIREGGPSVVFLCKPGDTLCCCQQPLAHEGGSSGSTSSVGRHSTKDGSGTNEMSSTEAGTSSVGNGSSSAMSLCSIDTSSVGLDSSSSLSLGCDVGALAVHDADVSTFSMGCEAGALAAGDADAVTPTGETRGSAGIANLIRVGESMETSAGCMGVEA